MQILIALLIFGILVAFHEFGHFIIAKANGITVIEFSIGMGPRLLSFVKGGTRYSLKLFPIGGSCAMGEDDPENMDEHNFNNRGVWARISTIFAGPFFNFILAFLFAIILTANVGYDPAVVVDVPQGSYADQAGLQVGDRITEIDGKNVTFARDINLYEDFIGVSKEPFKIKYRRDGKSYETIITPNHTKKLMLGFQYTSISNQINKITKNSAMEEAGVVAGDTITKMNGIDITDTYRLSQYFQEHSFEEGTSIVLEYEHNGKIKSTTLTPRWADLYTLGFDYNPYYEKTNVLGAIKYSFSSVRYWIETTVRSLGSLLSGGVGLSDLGGPVRIVDELGTVVEAKDEVGIRGVLLTLLEWAIFLSANLGVMNLLPIPALDGGRLVFLFLEALRGKPISREKEGYVHGIGFILLMVLMVFIFFNDIKNVFF